MPEWRASSDRQPLTCLQPLKPGPKNMDLKVVIEDQEYTLNVPDELVHESTDFFTELDRELDRGRQMGREWVVNPNHDDRLRIVGDRLLSALETERHDVGRMMAAYILWRAPNIQRMVLDTSGEIQATEIEYQ